MQEVVCEILFDDIALVPAADDEVVYAVVGIGLQDVPQNGLTTDFNHRLGTGRGFLADTCSQPTRKNDCFQFTRSEIKIM